MKHSKRLTTNITVIMKAATKLYLEIPPPVNLNNKKSKFKIIVNNIDGYTDFTPRQKKNFFRKVSKDGPIHPHKPELGRCWEWTAGLFTGGYGSFSMFGRMRKPHRVSWLMHKGSIPKGEGFHGTCVCHSCDNRGCVNPDHLFLGTHTDNMRDMEAKGRADHPKGDRNGIKKHPEVLKRGVNHYWHINAHLMPRGSSHKGSKLNEEQVRAIRIAKRDKIYGHSTSRKLAEIYGVSIILIQKLAKGVGWSHVTIEPLPTPSPQASTFSALQADHPATHSIVP